MPRVTGGVVLGLGLGGFIDGITLHQIAQWHNMGSAVLPPHTMEAMSQNMVWDGEFHFATWVLTVVGIFMMWNAAHAGRLTRSASAFSGEMIFGWGVFNLVEGIIDHHILELHHVRDVPMHLPAYDWMFLGFGGVGLILLGRLLMRGQSRRVQEIPR